MGRIALNLVIASTINVTSSPGTARLAAQRVGPEVIAGPPASMEPTDETAMKRAGFVRGTLRFVIASLGSVLSRRPMPRVQFMLGSTPHFAFLGIDLHCAKKAAQMEPGAWTAKNLATALTIQLVTSKPGIVSSALMTPVVYPFVKMVGEGERATNPVRTVFMEKTARLSVVSVKTTSRATTLRGGACLLEENVTPDI